MKLIDKEKICAEIERLKKQHCELTEFNSGYKNAANDILSFINSMEEEPKRQNSAAFEIDTDRCWDDGNF